MSIKIIEREPWMSLAKEESLSTHRCRLLQHRKLNPVGGKQRLTSLFTHENTQEFRVK